MSAEPIHQDDADVLEVIVDDDGKVIEAPEGKAEDAEPQDSQLQIDVAASMGWKPLDQWKGDPSNWRPASAFLKEVPEVLRNTRKKNDRLEGQFARVIAQVSRLTETQQRQMDADDQAALTHAIETGDIEGAQKIVADIKAAAAAPKDVDIPPELADFEDRNKSWMGVDPDATALVKVLDARFASEAGGVKNPTAHLKRIEDEIKRRFPEHFPDDDGKKPEPKPGERRAPPLGRGTRTPGASRPDGQITAADLTPAQRKAAREMDVSDADYVKNYNKFISQGRER